MSGHTAGPWWPVQDTGKRWYVATRRDRDKVDAKPSPFGATIAHSIGDHTEARTSGNEEANARLIAAAPELLDDGQFLLDRLSDLENVLFDDAVARDFYGHVEPAIARMRAAIAKAKGETP